MMVRYCNQSMVYSDNKLEALRTKDDEVGGADTNMQRVVGKTKKAKPKAAGARPHVKRSLFALPPIGPVDLSQDGIQWHLLCLLRPGTNNVAMETTTQNFVKLFEIVGKQLDVSTALIASGVQTPGRKLRRNPSNDLFPKGTSGSKQYHIKSKG